MSGEIAAVAKNWLTEPRYVGAFKLTSDVFKDYLCNIMLGVGSIVLAVNFLASMGTGPINCMLKSKSNINKPKGLKVEKEDQMLIGSMVNRLIGR